MNLDGFFDFVVFLVLLWVFDRLSELQDGPDRSRKPAKSKKHFLHTWVLKPFLLGFSFLRTHSSEGQWHSIKLAKTSSAQQMHTILTLRVSARSFLSEAVEFGRRVQKTSSSVCQPFCYVYY